MSQLEKKHKVAVVGMSCCFANADNYEELWRMLIDEAHTSTDLKDRFCDYDFFYHPNKNVKGKSYSKMAALLNRNLYEFDNRFFELSPKEAEVMDVQQRFLLELTNIAFEDAGISPFGRKAGVFVGGFMTDALVNSSQSSNILNVNKYSSTGLTLGMLANKISYFYNLRGPSITIDTACSSSLVALHYACSSIISGECEIAVCGGVNIINNLSNFISLSKGEFLSKKSLCQAFSDAADGYARGEGAGVLILKNLDKAQKDKDRIYCEVIATHTNHDGRKMGITLPNQKAQEEMLRQIYENAGVGVDDLGYIEAHGTGTQAGDLAEITALNNVFKDRLDKLVVGSVKTNIGHTEGAAGIAGVIKAILILQYKQIPKSLHSDKLNKRIDFDNVDVARELQPLNHAGDGRFYVGVNSFGFGGSNAHAILASTLDFEKNDMKTFLTTDSQPFLMISARSEKALRDLASLYATFVKASKYDVNKLCAAAALRRTHFEHRLGVVAESGGQLMQKLNMFSKNASLTGVTYKVCNSPKRRKIAFVFSGMGVQHDKMGLELYNSFPQFKKMFDECCNVFYEISGVNLMDKSLNFFRAENLQPYNLAYQISLFSLVVHLGLACDGVLGHSAGEMAAFYCSGLMSLRDVFTVCYHRSRLQQQLSGKGKMIHLGIDRCNALDICKKYDFRVSLAAVNGKSSVVLSGDEHDLLEIKELIDDSVGGSKFLHGDIAYHSWQMDSIENEFLKGIEETVYDSWNIPLYSSVTGKRLDVCCPQYWWKNIRQTVEFQEAVTTLVKDGYDCFIEIGAHPVLHYYISEHFLSLNKEHVCEAVQHRKRSQIQELLQMFSNLYCKGVYVDWEKFFNSPSEWIPLPLYPWNKSVFKPKIQFNQYELQLSDRTPILGKRLNLHLETWESLVNVEIYKGFKGHVIVDRVLFPAAGYMEMLIEMGAFQIEELAFVSSISLHSTKDTIFMCTRTDEHSVIISATDEKRDGWTLSCKATINCGEPSETRKLNICTEGAPLVLQKDSIYGVLRQKSLNYEKDFRMLARALVGDGFAVAYLENSYDYTDYMKRIYIIDACFQTAALSVRKDIAYDRENLCLPSSIGKMVIYKNFGWDDAYIYAHVSYSDSRKIIAQIYLVSHNGDILIEFIDTCFSYVVKPDDDFDYIIDSCLYKSLWEEIDIPIENHILSSRKFVNLSSACMEPDDDCFIFYASDDVRHDIEMLLTFVKEIEEHQSTLVVVTCNAFKVTPEDLVINYTQRALWGLCRTIRLEHSNLDIILVDADDLDMFDISSLTDDENELAFRAGKIMAFRVKREAVLESGHDMSDTAVITGASGGVAYELGLVLAHRGVKNFALVSRSSPPRLLELIDILLYYNLSAYYYNADVTNLDSLEKAVGEIRTSLLPIRHVFHLAGVTNDMMIARLDVDSIMQTIEPKVTGAQNLYAIFKTYDLDNFVFFSSLVGLTGNIGQGAYSAANAFLEGFSEYILSNGMKMKNQVVGFGALQSGMAVVSYDVEVGLKKRGIGMLPTSNAIRAFFHCLSSPTYITKINWNEFLGQGNQKSVKKYQYLLSEDNHNDQNLIERLMLLDESEQVKGIQDFIVEVISYVLEYNDSSPNLDCATDTLGINSLNSILIATSINKELNTNLTYSQIVGSFSIRELAKTIWLGM